jgi:hypothetical protein
MLFLKSMYKNIINDNIKNKNREEMDILLFFTFVIQSVIKFNYLE